MPDSLPSPDSARLNARNTGTGTQPIHQGPGAQQVLAGSNGKQYNLSAGGDVHGTTLDPVVASSLILTHGVLVTLSGDDDKNEPKEASREWLSPCV